VQSGPWSLLSICVRDNQRSVGGLCRAPVGRRDSSNCSNASFYPAVDVLARCTRNASSSHSDSETPDDSALKTTNGETSFQDTNQPGCFSCLSLRWHRLRLESLTGTGKLREVERAFELRHSPPANPNHHPKVAIHSRPRFSHQGKYELRQ
jgi:hypothetical protein